jgi:hypothetical protein
MSLAVRSNSERVGKPSMIPMVFRRTVRGPERFSEIAALTVPDLTKVFSQTEQVLRRQAALPGFRVWAGLLFVTLIV